LGVRQNESIHPKLESRLGEYGNPESQQALVRRHACQLTGRLESK
jgi:hypothetical protein